MTFFQQYWKIAERFPGKLAILGGSGNYQFKSLLEYLPSFEEQILSVTGGKGRRIAFRSKRYELYVMMMLMASKHGYELIFQRDEIDPIVADSIDWFVSDFAAPEGVASNFVLIDVKKLAPHQASKKESMITPNTEAEFIFGTSGSTGKAKFFPIKESYWLNSLKSCPNIYGAPDQHRRVFCSVAYSMAWYNNVSLRVLLEGGSVLALGTDMTRLPVALDLYGVNTLCMTPALMQRLLDTPNVEQFISSVKTVVLGGATLDIDLIKRTHEMTHAQVSGAYGATETRGVCDFTFDPNEDYETGFTGNHSDDNVELGFFDEDGNILPDANEGILGVKSDKYVDPRRYLGQSKSDEASAFKDGYFITGDIFSRRGSKLFIVGRSKQIINAGGNKFSLERIDIFLSKRHPDQQFVVKVITNDVGNEMLHAYFVGGKEPNIEEVNVALFEAFRGVKIRSFSEIAKIPLSESGKIDRNSLK